LEQAANKNRVSFWGSGNVLELLVMVAKHGENTKKRPFKIWILCSVNYILI
jgi:hypothetical protein